LPVSAAWRSPIWIDEDLRLPCVCRWRSQGRRCIDRDQRTSARGQMSFRHFEAVGQTWPANAIAVVSGC
jgi:hypothetical protein